MAKMKKAEKVKQNVDNVESEKNRIYYEFVDCPGCKQRFLYAMPQVAEYCPACGAELEKGG